MKHPVLYPYKRQNKESANHWPNSPDRCNNMDVFLLHFLKSFIKCLDVTARSHQFFYLA